MKNKLLKFYTVSLFLCSDFVLFAQPGANDNTSTLESGDTVAAPIDNYISVLALMGLLLVFTKFKTFQKEDRYFSMKQNYVKLKTTTGELSKKIIVK